MFRKTKGMGPGNCRGRECETFCNEEKNKDICRAFAEENGLLPPEDAGRREEGQRQMKSAFSQMPPEVARCVKDALGADRFDQIFSGQVNPGDMSGIMDNCFSQMPRGGDASGPPSGDGQAGSLQGGQVGSPRGLPERIGPPIEGQEGRRPPEGYLHPEQVEQYQNQIPGEYPEQYGSMNSPQDRQFQEGATLEGFQQQFQEQYREQVEQQTNTQIQQTLEQQYPSQEPQPQILEPAPSGETAPVGNEAPTSYHYSSEDGLASLLHIFFGLFR